MGKNLGHYSVAIVLSISFGAIENSGVNQAFSDVVALIGGVSGSLLGFILPPLLYMGAYKEPGEIGALSRVIMISIVIIGMFVSERRRKGSSSVDSIK
eukprot:jgi/Bigna1/147518/aug1.183_g22226